MQPVHPSLFHTGAGWTNQRLARRTTYKKARMHRPWRPLRCGILSCWISVRPICSALDRELFLLHPHRLFKTNLSSVRCLFCARYRDLFNLYTSDSLKIGLRARVPCECAYAETIWFRSVWQRIREYFYFSRTLHIPPPSPFLSVRSHFPILLQTFGINLTFRFVNQKKMEKVIRLGRCRKV